VFQRCSNKSDKYEDIRQILFENSCVYSFSEPFPGAISFFLVLATAAKIWLVVRVEVFLKIARNVSPIPKQKISIGNNKISDAL